MPDRNGEPVSLRERKKARTREELITVATRLFLDKGFDETTVDEIAAAAGVSQRTFFRYFPSKEALVFRDHETRLGEVRRYLHEERTRRTPMDAVLAGCRAFGRYYQDQADALLTEAHIVGTSRFLIGRDVELDLEFQRAVQDTLMSSGPGEALPKREARFYAGAILGVIRATMQEWFGGECREDLAALGESALRLILKVD